MEDFMKINDMMIMERSLTIKTFLVSLSVASQYSIGRKSFAGLFSSFDDAFI